MCLEIYVNKCLAKHKGWSIKRRFMSFFLLQQLKDIRHNKLLYNLTYCLVGYCSKVTMYYLLLMYGTHTDQ